MSATAKPCKIIGVLDNGMAGLTPIAADSIRNADVIVGGHRTLALFDADFSANAQTYDLTGQLVHVPNWIQEALDQGKQAVVLATGDPLCHGIGKYLIGKLGSDVCEVVPNISTIQLACARLGVAWQELPIYSVHSKDAGEWAPGAGPEHGLYPLMQAVKQNQELALYTSPENGPDRIARMLQSEGLGNAWQMSVAECLLQEAENIKADLCIADAAQQSFADPNVVILRRATPAAKPVLFGLADDSFIQRKPEKGLITKREVRAVSLARLQLRSDSVLWDIGAGSGSVGLEAARLCPQGHVYAMEKNAEDAQIARDNRLALGITNYSLTQGKAPEGLEQWPDPDAVFIGGSGGELAQLIQLSLDRLKPGAWLVMNFVTLENLGTATETLKVLGVDWDVTQLSAARSQPILNMQRMAAENPVWIVSAQSKLEGEVA